MHDKHFGPPRHEVKEAVHAATPSVHAGDLIRYADGLITVSDGAAAYTHAVTPDTKITKSDCRSANIRSLEHLVPGSCFVSVTFGEDGVATEINAQVT